MPDNRPLREKLEAMANQTDSPEEAEIARAIIMNMIGVHEDKKDPRVLTRDDILGTPDRESAGKTMRYRTKSGVWYTIDLDEMDIGITQDT